MNYPSNQPAEGQVKSYFSRWERLEADKAALATDLKELFAEAKANGYDTKAMRAAFRQKVEMDDAKAAQKAEAFDEVVGLYLAALTGTVNATRADRAQTHEPEQGTASSGDFQREPASVPLVSDPPRDADAQRLTEGPHPNTPVGTPAGEAEPPQVGASSATPKRQWKHSDPAHPDCLDPGTCGGFSNNGVCGRCKEAAAGGQTA